MSPVSEIGAMKEINDILSQIDDSAMRDRILQWAWSKFSSKKEISILTEEKDKKQKKKKSKSKKVTKSKTSYSILKDLNLKPNDKETFSEFVSTKKPSSNQDKCVVSVYYLINILEEMPISANHIFTCFKIMNWRVPSDLDNTLQWVASQKGWLDTGTMTDIKLTTLGENYIEHDLPPKKDKS